MKPKRTNGAQSASDAVSSMFAAVPAANPFAMSQRFALESARFWARRMHAYADQMEALACCSNVDELANAQTRFIDRMREDYAEETKAMSALLTPPVAEPDHASGSAGAD